MKLHTIGPLAAALLLAGCATAPAGKAASDTIDIARFRAVSVSPIQFAAAAVSALPDSERAALEADLLAALKDAVPASRLTDETSTDIVRIEVTVTELNASNPTVNVLTTLLLFVPFDVGGIGFDARFYTGDSREPFATTTYRHTSTPLQLKGSFSRYGHATKALHTWAESLTGIASKG